MSQLPRRILRRSIDISHYVCAVSISCIPRWCLISSLSHPPRQSAACPRPRGLRYSQEGISQTSIFIFLFIEPLYQQAESELSDKNKREELDAIMNQARIEILKSYNLSSTLAHNDPILRDIVEPSFKVRVRARAKDILIEEEVRRRK
jgi:hypothetical protein